MAGQRENSECMKNWGFLIYIGAGRRKSHSAVGLAVDLAVDGLSLGKNKSGVKNESELVISVDGSAVLGSPGQSGGLRRQKLEKKFHFPLFLVSTGHPGVICPPHPLVLLGERHA